MKTFDDVADRTRYRSRLREHNGHTLFRCRCGREVYADMMLDVTGVPEELRGQDTHRCDGCWRRWIALRLIDPDELRRLTGQPPRSNRRKAW